MAAADLSPSDAFWWEVLESQGIGRDELERARRHGTLELLALERAILLDPTEFDVTETAAQAGIDPTVIRKLWRALGFPDPHPGEKVFTRGDVDMLRSVGEFIGDGTLTEDLVLQMARVIGSSLARIAVAQVEASQVRKEPAPDEMSPERTEEVEAREVERSAQLVPMLSTVLDSVWRRHLAVAVGRRNARGEDPDAHEIAIGFADLEGFTALSQQLPDDELAQVVDRFETIAYDVVSAHAGRVVKMIGDEVMFSADDVVAGAEIALALAESYAADEALADVRVGLAAGQALELEGDLYGPAVNLASRIVSLAYPGTVVVSQEVVDALGDDERFKVRALRPHHLKNIGRVKLYALRRSTGEASAKTLARARDRRDARRAWIAERMAERS
jgi:adenylate cyclase